MSRDTFLINWVLSGEQEQKEIQQYLKNIYDQYGFFSTFFISEKTRNYYYHEGILKSISFEDPHDIWYFDFVAGGKNIDLDVDSNEAENGVLTIFINFRIEDYEGNLLGVVGVGIQLNQLVQTLRDKQNQYNRNIYLVDESGIIQVHTDISLIDKLNIYEEDGISQISEELMGVKEVPVDLMYKKGSENILVSSRYIPELDWHVFVEQDEKSSFVDVRKGLYIDILLILFICLIPFSIDTVVTALK